jgi:hypothetical protein
MFTHQNWIPAPSGWAVSHAEPRFILDPNTMNSFAIKKLLVDCHYGARSKMELLLGFREMGGSLSFRRPRVFGIAEPHLGDHWIAFCHFIRFRRFSRLSHRLGLKPGLGITTEQWVSLVRQIATILKVEAELEFADEPPELELPVHPARNGKTLLIPHSFQTTRKFIAFQFDGISRPDLNPTPEEVESFLACFDQSLLRRVGRPLTLEECVQVLATSKLFMGISSGMSHVAASTGTPALLFLKGGAKDQNRLKVYQHLRRWNPYPNTHIFSNVNELKRILALISA